MPFHRGRNHLMRQARGPHPSRFSAARSEFEWRQPLLARRGHQHEPALLLKRRECVAPARPGVASHHLRLAPKLAALPHCICGSVSDSWRQQRGAMSPARRAAPRDSVAHNAGRPWHIRHRPLGDQARSKARGELREAHVWPRMARRAWMVGRSRPRPLAARSRRDAHALVARRFSRRDKTSV